MIKRFYFFDVQGNLINITEEDRFRTNKAALEYASNRWDNFSFMEKRMGPYVVEESKQEEKKYSKDLWPWKYGERWMQYLRKYKHLTVRERDNPEERTQQFASYFDKAAKKYSKERLDRVVKWVAQSDWIERGFILSPSKFLDKKDEFNTYFEFFEAKADREDDPEAKLPLPDKGDTLTENKLEPYIEVYGEDIKDKFAMIGYDKYNSSLKKYKYTG